MNQKIHFSGLNGIRAIAAIAVLFAHTSEAMPTFGLDPINFGKYADGSPKHVLLAQYGVTIFFALSGFLITYLLLQEKSIKEINIKNFYIRRILRIWPLYYSYMALSLFTAVMFGLSIKKSSLFFYIFLSANIPWIFGGTLYFLGHYWSLGSEEQFYSFWPWVVKKSKSILLVTVVICISLITLKCILRYVDVRLKNGVIGQAINVIETTRFQCMLIGAIGAILHFQNNKKFFSLVNNTIAQSIAWFAVLLLALNKFHVISFLNSEFIAVITVVLIMGQILKTKRIVNLDTGLPEFIGKISYGVYIIHPLIIFYLSKVIGFDDRSAIFNRLLVYLVVFSATILLAYLSYEFFEKRFLKLKEKYSTVESSS